jgi:hypothetical protein
MDALQSARRHSLVRSLIATELFWLPNEDEVAESMF